MTQFTRFNYSNDKQITAQIADELSDFLWIAFAQNSDGNCIIEKQAPFSPTQIYFSLERSITKVTNMDLDSLNIYASYDDTILLGEIISKINPLTNTTTISRGSIVEAPIDVKVNGSDLWFLLPGDASGTNTQLLKYDTSGIFQETVDLSKSGLIINNASSMVIDAIGDIWICTFTDPMTIVRVFQISGGLYDFTEEIII